MPSISEYNLNIIENFLKLAISFVVFFISGCAVLFNNPTPFPPGISPSPSPSGSALVGPCSGNVSSPVSGVTFLMHMDGPTGPISHGTTITDSSGNGNNGVAQNVDSTGLSYTTGVVGQAIYFDGIDDFLQMPNNAAYDFDASTSFTISVWIKTTTGGPSGNSKIIAKRTGSNWYTIHLNNQKFPKLELTGPSGPSLSQDVRDGQWHHLIGVVDRTTSLATLYLDYQSTSSTSYSASSSNTSILTIGRYTTTYFEGLIDEVAIWNRALSVSEVNAVYCKGLNQVPL